MTGINKAFSAWSARWVADILIGELNYRNMSVDEVNITDFRELLNLLWAGTITDKCGIDVLRIMLDHQDQHESPRNIIARLNLYKIPNDSWEVKSGLLELEYEYPDAFNDKVVKYLLGVMMKKTRGRVDPTDLETSLKEYLNV
jgi:aspartyl-tRNA(Asn)/glutamyl-tRNA(Gln) amidotransferase subunit B